MDLFVLSETKIDSSFLSAQFEIDIHEVKAHSDRNYNWGGWPEYVCKGIKSRRLEECETLHSQKICSEVTLSGKTWLCISIYRPTEANNLLSFFKELNTFLSKACCKYENYVLMGDFNMMQDLRETTAGNERLLKVGKILWVVYILREVRQLFLYFDCVLVVKCWIHGQSKENTLYYFKQKTKEKFTF